MQWLADPKCRGYVSGNAPSDTAYTLTVAGSVDLLDAGITRLNVANNANPYAFALSNLGSKGNQNRLFANNVSVRFASGDLSLIRSDATLSYLAVSMFVVPADSSALPTTGTPTPADIYHARAAGAAFESQSTRTTAGDLTGTTIYGPHANDPLGPTTLEPGKKYWVLLLPTWTGTIPVSGGFNGGFQTTTLTSQPFSSTDTWLNTWGRAISLWTGRPGKGPAVTLTGGSVVSAGTSLTLSMTPDDYDKTGTADYQRRDLAGVQVQYAAQATAANPSPVWQDLPFTHKTGYTGTGNGFYFTQNGSTSLAARDGCHTLWSTLSVPIKCGSTAGAAGEGALPSGKWQIRVRTFEFGHPFPGNTAVGPAGYTPDTQAFTPNTYPSALASPWSNTVRVTVMDQCPPPVPTYPIGGAAVIATSLPTLTWRYRNTSGKTQAARMVQIRMRGEATWTTLTSGAGTSPTYTLTSGYPLTPGTEYEWRVQVTDSDTPGAVSNYSEVARFWAVAALSSGSVAPTPAVGVDAGTLGVGTHRVEVYRRGGTERVGELTGLTKVEWNRVRDDVSTAKVVVEGWDAATGNLLADLQTWAYEIVITRDNGYSRDRVWEGPITLLTYKADQVVIDAKDVIAYLYRRIIKQVLSDIQDGDTVVNRAIRVIQNALAPDDPNVLAYLAQITSASDAMQYRYTPAWTRTAFEEVDDMAANAGLDYTAIGRSIQVWGTKNPIGFLPEFRDEDLGNAPVVSEYGMSMANVYGISDGNGLFGFTVAEGSGLTKDGDSVSGNDPTYGLVEMLSSSWASESEADSGTYTAEGRAKVIASFEEGSERSIADRYPPPVIVRVPDNTSLNPDVQVSIQHLVPGVAIPLRSVSTLRKVASTQKLDSVKVVEEAGKETVTVTLSPFAAVDAATEGS